MNHATQPSMDLSDRPRFIRSSRICTYEAVGCNSNLLLSNGKRETLLRVPRYDFNWQTSYQLAEPRHVPVGSWLVVTGGFDNSAANPIRRSVCILASNHGTRCS